MPSDAHQSSRWRALRGGPLAVVSALAGLVLLFLLARSALDVLAVLLLCATIVLLERTIGDWFAERLGPMGGNALFVVLVGAFLWGLLGTDRGQDASKAILKVGSERGFQSAVLPVRTTAATGSSQSFVRRPPNQAAPPAPSSSASAPSAAAPGRTASPSGNVQSGSGVNRAPASAGVGAGSGVATSGASAQGASGGTPVSPSLAGSHTVAQSPDVRAAAQHGGGVPPAVKAPSRVIVRTTPGDEPRWMALHAQVTSGPDTVAEGTVEFSLNGRVVARVPVNSDGTAEARMANLSPGYYRVTARFAGTDRFLEATADTNFSI